MKTTIYILIITALLQSQAILSNPLEIHLNPIPGKLMTSSIQKAIDSCGDAGGGTVFFTKGSFLSGTLNLKSGVILKLNKGAILTGSSHYADYSNDAFIFGKDLNNIAILGEGTIDGADCYNPHGEEGFRGPHCIRLINCTDIRLQGITITRSANWAINCRYCKKGTVENVIIRGGHDGLHTRFCENFKVTGCDFRTGDDCFAGNDNRDFEISNCLVNTSCSGFRFGCLNLKIDHCKIWGPGEYMHRIRKVRRMPTAFVHFSPADENPALPSSNWIISNLEVDSVEHFYVYNHLNGLWQTGQPASSIKFENVKAKAIMNAFYIVDNSERNFSLSLENCSFSFLDGSEYKPAHFEDVKFRSYAFLYAENFDFLKLTNVSFEKKGSDTVFSCRSGNTLNLNNITFLTPDNKLPFSIKGVKTTTFKDTVVNGKPLKIN